MNSTFLYWNFRTALAWGLAVVAVVTFVATNPGYLNSGNLYALMQSYSVLVLVACGLAAVMLVGEFDLSIAGLFPLAGLMTVRLSDAYGPVAAVALAVVVGLVFGAVNGWITAALRIPSLAVTVGSMVLAIGIGYAVAGGELVQSQNFRPGLELTQPIGGIFSLQSLIQLVLAIAAAFLIKTTWQGKHLFAVGSDATRARASGLPVTRTVTVAFMLSGAFAALAGALQGLALATGQAGANEAFLLQAATAAILGGIALTGGKGSLVGVFGAAFLLAVISNGLSLVGSDSATIQLVNGAILLAVVLLDRPLNQLLDRRVQSRPVPTPSP